MWRTWGDRLGAAGGFTVLLTVSWYALGRQSGSVQSRWVDWASTNVVNLADHPVFALILSAFVGESGLGQWLALAAVGLAATGWVFGAWRTALLVSAAHVIGTYLSEGVLAARIAAHLAPRSDLYIRDVGPSYVVIAGLAAAVAYGRWAGRVPAAIGFTLMAPGSFAGLPGLDVAAIGHLCSVLVALCLGWFLLPGRRPAKVRRRRAGPIRGRQRVTAPP
jgi:hypothetical protein